MKRDITIPPGTVLVFDSGPILALVTGLPFKVLSAVSFIQNSYRKAREKAIRENKTFVEIAPELRSDFVEQLERKEEGEDLAFALFKYCFKNPSHCVIPNEVLGELIKYEFQGEVRDFIKLVSSKTGRTSLVASFNAAMRRIGRGEDSRHPQTINPVFFERLIGPGVSWRSVNLADIEHTDHLFQKWLWVVRSVSKRIGNLSNTDALLIAYTATLNNNGVPALLVTGDRNVRKIATLFGVPVLYIYDGKMVNKSMLGRLELKPKRIHVVGRRVGRKR